MFTIDEKHTFDQALASGWFKVKEELDALKARESLLRKQIADAAFPEDERIEGANNKLDIGGGYVLQLDHKINRTVDEAGVLSLSEEMRKEGIAVDDVFKTKLSFGVAAYRKLDEDQVKLVDQCLTEKPGTPGLKIVLPKKA